MGTSLEYPRKSGRLQGHRDTWSTRCAVVLPPPLWHEAAPVLTAAFDGMFAIMAKMACLDRRWNPLHRAAERARRIAYNPPASSMVLKFSGRAL
jgi:hypothetical protein